MDRVLFDGVLTFCDGSKREFVGVVPLTEDLNMSDLNVLDYNKFMEERNDLNNIIGMEGNCYDLSDGKLVPRVLLM